MIYSRLKGALVWFLLTGVCLALTPYIFAYADTQRGYNATGGEIFIPFLPVLCWLIVRTVKDTFKEFKNTERIENND